MAKSIITRNEGGQAVDERVQIVEKLALFALNGKDDIGVVDDYNRSIAYYTGNHRIKQRPKSKGNNVYNKFAEIVDTRLAHLTDARPKWIFRPQEESDLWAADALNQIMGDVVWDYIQWDNGEDGGGKGEDAVLQAAFAGSCHIKTLVDVKTGYPDFEVIPIGHILVDPKAKKKSELRYWIHLTTMGVKEIKRRFGKEVTAQADIELTQDKDKANFYRPMLSAELTTSNKMDNLPFLLTSQLREQSPFGPDAFGRAVVMECWMEDFTMEQIPFDETETDAEHRQFEIGNPVIAMAENNHPKHIKAHKKYLNKLDAEIIVDGVLVPNPVREALLFHINAHEGFEQTQQRRKYPFGRRLTVSQGQVLDDRPNPFGIAGIDFRDVLIKWDYAKNPESYWGKSLTKDLFDPQDSFNHRKNSITQNINRLTNGVLKVKASLLNSTHIKGNPKKFSNRIGKILPFLNDPNEITEDFGPELPSHYFQDLIYEEQLMERLGQHEAVGQGRLPAAGTASSTVEQLLGEFKTIMRKPLRHYSSALIDMAKNAVAIMVTFMSPDERFLILGQDGQKYEQVQWKDLAPAASQIRNIRIDVAKLMPTSRQTSFRKAVELVQAGIYDAQAALEELDDPKKYEVIQRMSQINQLAQMVQAGQQENQELKKQINTLMNRLQTSEGIGNVESFNTGE